jgi:hypothetical protein
MNMMKEVCGETLKEFSELEKEKRDIQANGK